MLDIFYVTFAGHREIEHFREVEDKLYEIVCDLIRTKEYVEFYVGNDGEFDIMATSAVRRARKAQGAATKNLRFFGRTDVRDLRSKSCGGT